MPDVQEVFRMATENVTPDPNPLERQLRRQRKSSRGSRTTVYLTVAAVLAAIAIALVALQRSMDDTTKPGDTQSPASSFAEGLPGATPQTAEVIDLSGERTSVVHGLPPDAYAISYVPSANEIAFIASTDTGVDVVGVLDTSSGVARIVPTPEGLIVGSSIRLGGVALSPDGTRIAFTAVADGNTDIYVANLDGTGLMRLTDDPATDQFPQWSPDGTTIVYDNGGPKEDPADPQYSRTAEIYSVATSGGSQPVRLTDSKGPDNAPSFSPDGRRIVFFRLGEIWTMASDGSDQQRLLAGNGKGGFTPRWSPNGSKIAFTNYTPAARPTVALGSDYAQQPLVIVGVVDVTSGQVTDLSNVAMATDYNIPQWVDDGHLLVLRVPKH
jgi:Tol biopolymer transport system component